MDAPMAGFHLVFCADPAATGIMIYEVASAYKEADIFEREMPRYLSHLQPERAASNVV